MREQRQPLIIPCETQSREFDAKLLLACFAAERGFPVIVGSKKEIYLRIGALPRSIFLSKSLTNRNRRLYDLLGKLGHRVVCGDEEALIYFSPESYLNSKVGEEAFRKAEMLLAWGPENEEVWRNYRGYHGVPIVATGNSRVDLLRPELRSYFDAEAKKIRSRYGRFVLVNTNFSRMNHHYPKLSHQRWILEQKNVAEGGPSEFAVGFAAHKKALFESFLEMVGFLAQSFRDVTVVVRPHPSENHGPWREAGGDCPNLHVVHEGNAIPWLRAAELMVHNGCTTAVETYLMGGQAVAYQPVTSDLYDLSLANELSVQAFDLETLKTRVAAGLAGTLGLDSARAGAQRKLIERHVTALDGPFASERIVDVLEAFAAEAGPRRPALGDVLHARLRLALRSARKRYEAYVPESRNNREYLRHMFPGVSLPEVRERLTRFQGILGRFRNVGARELYENIFEVTSEA